MLDATDRVCKGYP